MNLDLGLFGVILLNSYLLTRTQPQYQRGKLKMAEDRGENALICQILLWIIN